MKTTESLTKTLLIALFVFAIAFQNANTAETIDRIVAVVNEDPITHSEMREMVISMNPTTSAQQIDERTILQQMIEQKIFEQEAEKLGITVSEQELDASMEQARRKYNLNEEQMAEVLKKQNLTPESFREQYRMQALGNKLLSSQLKNKIVITDDEIIDYYQQNYGGLGSTPKPVSANSEQVRISHILISADSANAEQKANEVASMAKSGKNFSELAKEYSDDSLTANKGGDLGSFKKGDLIEPLEQAVERTPEGKVSDPVLSPAGYHIIKVDKRISEAGGGNSKSTDTEEVYIDDNIREEIQQTLYKQKAQEQLKGWLDNLKETAHVEIML